MEIYKSYTQVTLIFVFWCVEFKYATGKLRWNSGRCSTPVCDEEVFRVVPPPFRLQLGLAQTKGHLAEQERFLCACVRTEEIILVWPWAVSVKTGTLVG